MITSCSNSTEPKLEPSPVLISGNRERTVAEVIATCFSKTENRFGALLKEKGCTFPPKKLVLLGFKEEQRLEVYVSDGGKNTHLLTYKILALSGKRGPKQQEGDQQVPEGIYRVEYLNPNSQFHLSFKLNYPNSRDLLRAAGSEIAFPGTDIFIHGSEKSIGCLAIGDWAIEELFTLVALTGSENVRVLIFSNDARKTGSFLPCEVCPQDIESLYAELLEELKAF